MCFTHMIHMQQATNQHKNDHLLPSNCYIPDQLLSNVLISGTHQAILGGTDSGICGSGGISRYIYRGPRSHIYHGPYYHFTLHGTSHANYPKNRLN